MYLTTYKSFLKHLLATVPAGTGKDQSRGEWNSVSVWHYKNSLDQRPTLFDMDILESTNMIQGLAHLTHQELRFFSFEKWLQSGVDVCKCVSL